MMERVKTPAATTTEQEWNDVFMKYVDDELLGSEDAPVKLTTRPRTPVSPAEAPYYPWGLKTDESLSAQTYEVSVPTKIIREIGRYMSSFLTETPYFVAFQDTVKLGWKATDIDHFEVIDAGIASNGTWIYFKIDAVLPTGRKVSNRIDIDIPRPNFTRTFFGAAAPDPSWTRDQYMDWKEKRSQATAATQEVDRWYREDENAYRFFKNLLMK